MAKELKYTTDGKYSVFAGKTEIARSVIDPLTERIRIDRNGKQSAHQ